jgi:hypothetical protein
MVERDEADKGTAEEQAKESLRRGIQRSRAVISYYRQCLTILRDVAERRRDERPLFSFDTAGRLPGAAQADRETTG